MSIGRKIALYRREKGYTQEALAQMLNVTNQAVSKWESDQCCPDIQMLPKLADTFGVSIDALFDRETGADIMPGELPWEDDGKIRVVLYMGRHLLKRSEERGEFVFKYDGPARDVISAISVSCGNVGGDVDAGTLVNCGNVAGSVDAGSSVSCGKVEGSVDAGTYVQCGAVHGDVDAGTSVECGNVGGDVDAGSDVNCGEVHGSVDAGGTVTIKRNG